MSWKYVRMGWKGLMYELERVGYELVRCMDELKIVDD